MRKLHFPALTPQNSEALRLTVLQSTFWASMAIGGYQTVYLQNNGLMFLSILVFAVSFIKKGENAPAAENN